MKPGDIVYPFFEEENNTIGLLLEIDVIEQFYDTQARILIRGQIYSIPYHQIREIK